MKIAVSLDKKSGDIDPRFGRCSNFLVVDARDGKIGKSEMIENKAAEEGHGAGSAAAQFLAGIGTEAVITGKLGPNAANALKGLGVKAYSAEGNARKAAESLIAGKLHEMSEEPVSSKAAANSERIFLPLLDNNGMQSKISDHFGHAPFFGIYDSGKGKLEIIENSLDHHSSMKSPIDQIAETVNPTMIFAKGIGGRAISLIQERGLKLRTGDCDTVLDVIDNLESLGTDAKSCGHNHDEGHHGRH